MMNKRQHTEDDSSQLSIKEFAEIAGISQSALRFYDKKGIFKPSERGENGYRYYAPAQAVTVNYVKVMVDLGVPLARIKQLAAERNPYDLLTLLEDCENRLDGQLLNIQAAYSVVHTFRNRIQRGVSVKDGSLELVRFPQSNIQLGQVIDWTDYDSFYKPFTDFCRTAENERINLNYPIGGLHDSMEAFTLAPSQPDRFYSIDPVGLSTRKAGMYLVGYTTGYYGRLGDIAERMSAYALEHKLRFVGPAYNDYLLDEVSLSDRDSYLSQIAVAVLPA